MSQSVNALDPIEESNMTLMEHLIEFRQRLMWVVAGLAIGTIVSMLFVNPLLRFITDPLTDLGARTIAIGPTDTIGIFFKVSFTVGAALAMPVIVYQSIAFVAPGLYAHEKRTLILSLPGIMVLFSIGAAFAYFVLVPVAVSFLQSFEMPLVIAFLARAGLVSGPALRGFWRQAFVIIAIVAAAITPTVDPVNMTIVMLPLIALFFSSVGLAYMLYRERVPRDFSEEAEEAEEVEDATEVEDVTEAEDATEVEETTDDTEGDGEEEA